MRREHARKRRRRPLPLEKVLVEHSSDNRAQLKRRLFDQGMKLVAEVRAEGFSAVGRRYGVSDNAIRKWIRRYERELSWEPPA